MTDITIEVGESFAAVVTALETALSFPVYSHGAPAGVDTARPWVVVQYIPGGGPAGTATGENRTWRVGVRIIGAARTPNAHGEPTDAVYDAALFASDQARLALLAPAFRDTLSGRTVAVTHTGTFGADREGDVVNVTDDYQVTVDT